MLKNIAIFRTREAHAAHRRLSRKLLAAVLCIGSMAMASMSIAQAPTPELLFYKFDQTGTTVTNRASNPPANTGTATLLGGLVQGGSINGTFLKAVVGSGNSSSTDYVNTGWATNLSGSFSISFFSSEIEPSSTLFYVMGDNTAGAFRIFTNGVAGPGNWIMRGTGLNDIFLNGGAVVDTTMNTFVYDSAAQQLRTYLNGVLVSTVSQTTPQSLAGSGPFKVIGYSSNVGLNAGGKVGDVRVYSRALAPSEITAIYNAAFVDPTEPTPPPPPAPVPTLSEWAMILLGMLLAAAAVTLIHKRRFTT